LAEEFSIGDISLLLPRKLIFVDVETTGLSDRDRIVSFGAVELDSSEIANENLSVRETHLIFDPGIPSHPMALRVHGFNDWTLRHQNPFPLYARFIKSIISRCDLLVAHNADFDIKFLSRELAAAGESWPGVNTYCTMQAERRLGLPASLDAACSRIGLARRGHRHSAFEDAFRAMQIFLHQHGVSAWERDPIASKPSNIKKVPRKPKEGAPDRIPDAERARIDKFAESLALLRQEMHPGLLALRWVAGSSFANDENIASAVRAFVRTETAICAPEIIEKFAEIAVLDTIHAPCEWGDVRNALDAIRFDLTKRRRLSEALERCIRADSKVDKEEIERLREIAEYLGGRIAVDFIAT
jgi:DNA polymerase III subunit epsilon